MIFLGSIHENIVHTSLNAYCIFIFKKVRPLSVVKIVLKTKKELESRGRPANDGPTAIGEENEAVEHALTPGTCHDVLILVRGRCKCVVNVSTT